MKAQILQPFKDFLHLIYPHNCEGCGTDVLEDKALLCANCLSQMPTTNFVAIAENEVEKQFYGRLHLQQAAAAFYFTKESLMQHLLHQLKYKNNPQLGIYLGELIGWQLRATTRFDAVDIIVPLPLNRKRENKRGYNQATMLAQGIAKVWPKPVVEKAIVRTVFTQTQTKQGRIHRWQNMDGVFEIAQPHLLENKHILLVDDVVTTGATLEACGAIVKDVKNTQLSIVTLAYTS